MLKVNDLLSHNLPSENGDCFVMCQRPPNTHTHTRLTALFPGLPG